MNFKIKYKNSNLKFKNFLDPTHTTKVGGPIYIPEFKIEQLKNQLFNF